MTHHDTEFGGALALNVRNLREAQGLTQGQLLTKAGVPRATLSLMESGTANPTLGVLLRVCNALGIRLEEVLEPPASDTLVFRRDELPSKQRGRVTVRKLLPRSLSGVDMEELLIPVGETLTGVPHSVGTREYLVVHTGKLQLCVEGTCHILGEGDIVVFRGHQKHSYRNMARKESRAMSVIAQLAKE